MKKLQHRKLSLHLDTVRYLGQHQLGRAVGGATPQTDLCGPVGTGECIPQTQDAGCVSAALGSCTAVC